VPGKLSEDARASLLRMVETFEHEDGRALRGDEAIALGVEWSAGALGLVVAFGRKGAKDAEAGHPNLGDGSLRAAGEDDILLSGADELESLAHGLG
jgi:hypothetical protein